MKRNYLVISLAVVAVGLLGTQCSQSGAQIITEDVLRTHVEYLASEDLQGRKTLQPGNRAAAEYVASHFREFRLQPINGSEDYFQPVPVETFTLRQEETYCVMSTGDTLRWGSDFYLFPRKYATSISGPVLLCGYGIQAPEAEYDDYKNIEVSGKIVMALMGVPETDDTSNVFGKNRRSRHGMIPVKAMLAERLGAKALIVTTLPSHQDQVWQPAVSRKLHSWDADIIQAVGDIEFPVIYLNPQVASELINDWGGVKWSDYVETLNHELTGGALELGDLQLQFTFGFSDVVVDSAANVVGILRGSQGADDRQAVVIGAHYDHLGMDDTGIYYGADDNASGVSGILALAQTLAPMQEQLHSDIVFIAFAAEEVGLIGSRYFAENPVIPLDQTVAMLNLDCIGREGSSSYRGMHQPPQTEEERNLLLAYYSASYPDLKEITLSMTNPGTLDLQCDPLTGRYAFGDHAPFLERGVPVMFFFSGFHSDYHTPNDVVDRINFRKMTHIVYLVLNITIELSKETTMLEPTDDVPAYSSTPMH